MLALVPLLTSSARAAVHEDVRKKMGSRFEITAVAGHEAVARSAVEAAFTEIDRIEARISSWRSDSETSRLNARAGTGPVEVSNELLGLIERAKKVSALTGGAFDITFAGVGKLWDFKAEVPRLPEPEAVAAMLRNVGDHLLHLDRDARTVTLAPGTRIGFGAIGKGYAANRAAAVMKAMGVTGGVVNAGGDLFAFGARDDGSPWTVGIVDPLRRDHPFATLSLTDTAVVTSGDYESYVEIDGIRYAHILDPRTGYPVRGVRSVTIVCPNAELADALATSVFVLGRERGLALLNQLRGVEGVLVDDDGTLHASNQLESRLTTTETAP